MLARLGSASLRGLDAERVDVEVDLSRGLPCWNLVGLPEAAIRESRERIRSALINSGFEFPLRHITVNLAPANRKKDGSHFDLPVAIGILLASDQLTPANAIGKTFLLGELALDGHINPVAGALSMVMFAQRAGYHSVILPATNATEVTAISNLNILPASTLLEVVKHLAGQQALQTATAKTHHDDTTDMRKSEAFQRQYLIFWAFFNLPNRNTNGLCWKHYVNHWKMAGSPLPEPQTRLNIRHVFSLWPR